MEIRKSISSVGLFVIVLTCALWSLSTRAQVFYYSHAQDLPNAISSYQKQSIESYSLSILKNTLSKKDVNFAPASNTAGNKSQLVINLIRDEKNEDNYHWITPLFAFECKKNIRCTPNAGSQATRIAVSYIALAKGEGSADIAERFIELFAQYKGSDGFALLR